MAEVLIIAPRTLLHIAYITSRVCTTFRECGWNTALHGNNITALVRAPTGAISGSVGVR